MGTIKAIAASMLLLSAFFITGCGGNSESSVVIESIPIIENTNFNEFSFLKVNNPDLTNDVY